MAFKKITQGEIDKNIEKLIKNPKIAKEHKEFLQEVELKELLSKARTDNEITQSKLSEKTGLSQQAISRIEKGKGSTTLSTLIRYLDGLGYKLTIERKY